MVVIDLILSFVLAAGGSVGAQDEVTLKLMFWGDASLQRDVFRSGNGVPTAIEYLSGEGLQA